MLRRLKTLDVENVWPQKLLAEVELGQADFGGAGCGSSEPSPRRGEGTARAARVSQRRACSVMGRPGPGTLIRHVDGDFVLLVTSRG
jgi:hypothetical protein